MVSCVQLGNLGELSLGHITNYTMGMSRCYSLMKCLLILFNIVFLCIGVVVCGFSVWALWEGGAEEGAGGEGGAARAGLCALGAWAAVLALGAAAALAGAARRGAGLLAAAFALLALAAVAEAAAVSWGAAHLPQLRRALAARLHRAVASEYAAHAVPTQFIDAIQTELECCGAEGTRDWQQSAWSRAQAAAAGEPADAALDLSVSAPSAHYHVPASCCQKPDPAVDPEAAEAACAAARRVPAASGSAPGLHAAPCAPRVIHALEAGARLPLAAGAALLALHAAALLLALALCLRARPPPRYKA